LYECVGS